MSDLQKLVTYCLKNDRSAQKQLYTVFAAEMMGVCLRYTKTVADAEDVLQDGFVKVFSNLHQFREEGEIGAWIRRIMVNTALNHLKKNKVYFYDQLPDYQTKIYSEQLTESRLHTKDLLLMVKQLPAGYQAIFNLHAIEGYSHVEISALLGITDSTSRSQYARARTMMMEMVKKNYSEKEISNNEPK